MGSTRSFRSFYSRGSGGGASEAYNKASNINDTRLQMPQNPSKYSPKSSLYEKIMRRPRSPDKISNLSVPRSNTSTIERQKQQRLSPQAYDNPVFGRLVLTPVDEISSQDLANSRNNLQLTGRNSLILVQTPRTSNTTVQEIPAFLFKTTETSGTIITDSPISNSDPSNSPRSTSTQGSVSMKNDTDKDEENKAEVFV